MPSPELKAFPLAESPQDLYYTRLKQELAWVLSELEGMFVPKEEVTQIQDQPITKDRLERAHTWFQAVAEGMEGIPEDMDEDYVTELLDDLTQLYKKLGEVRNKNPLSESIETEQQRITDEIVSELRAFYAKGEVGAATIVEALGETDSADSMAFRKQLLGQPGVGEEVILTSIAGTSSDESIALRAFLARRGARMEDVARTPKFEHLPCISLM